MIEPMKKEIISKFTAKVRSMNGERKSAYHITIPKDFMKYWGIEENEEYEFVVTQKINKADNSSKQHVGPLAQPGSVLIEVYYHHRLIKIIEDKGVLLGFSAVLR